MKSNYTDFLKILNPNDPDIEKLEKKSETSKKDENEEVSDFDIK